MECQTSSQILTKTLTLQKEKQLLARRKEAQRQAAEKAKRDQEREVSRKAADRIPVPSQLAAIFEQLDGKSTPFPVQKHEK